MLSLEGAANDENIPADFRARVQKLLDEAELVESELWVRNVYGYFRNCYSPDGVSQNASDAAIERNSHRPPEHHLAVMAIRKYFPDHEPRLDLINDPGDGYGSRECTKCGTRIQYEAKVDAFAEPITAFKECPEGGEHE